MNKKQKYNIIIITPFYKRNHILEIYLDHLNYLKKDLKKYKIKLHAILIGSNSIKDEKNLIEDNNFTYVYYENSPLSNKWNRGIQELKNFDFEYAVILGSDDIVNDNFIYNMYNEIKQNKYEMGGALDLYFYDIDNSKSLYFPGYDKINHNCRYGETIGAGRFYSKKIIEYLDYNLWDDNLECSLDYNVLKRLNNNFKIYSRKLYNNEYIIDIKNKKIQINKFNEFIPYCIKSEDLGDIIGIDYYLKKVRIKNA